MSILVFQHDGNEDAAVLGETLHHRGHHLRTIRLDQHQSLPPDLDDVDGVLSLGGPMNVDQREEFPWMAGEINYLRSAYEAHLPIVGLCLGAQLLGVALGGTVAASESPEVGWHSVRLAFPGKIDPLFAGIRWDAFQFHLHGQELSALPPGGVCLAGSQHCRNQAFKAGMNAYGFQYHFEWTEQQIEQPT